jgi:hypothetical protein
MAIAGLVAGGLLLVFGRKLFWLFVGAVGFFAGMTLAARYFPDNSGSLWVVGVVVGLIGAVLAVFFQRVAVIGAGFLAGGYLATTLLGMFSAQPANPSWLPFLIGGILGALLMTIIFDWALILISSLTGAVLIANYAQPGQPLTTLLIVGLFILGIVLQSNANFRFR